MFLEKYEIEVNELKIIIWIVIVELELMKGKMENFENEREKLISNVLEFILCLEFVKNEYFEFEQKK